MPKARRFPQGRKFERLVKAVEIALAYSKSPLVTWRGDEAVLDIRLLRVPRIVTRWVDGEFVAEIR